MMPNRIELRPPYLLFIGDMQDRTYAKTALGLVHWRRNLVAGQLRLDPRAVDLGVPDMDVDAAVRAGVRSLVIGVATIGGVIPDAWWEVIRAAARAGLDIVNGLHGSLSDNPALVSAAESSGARLIDVRLPPKGIPVGSGRKRTGKRVLTVGTDCAVGKKYSALSLTEALQAIGVKATFRATGQTGIMIAGEGIPIDAVVADFVSGAAEILSPDNDEDHWDVIEGQGSLFHPGYAGVSLGLLHGSQPDAIVVCHDATRTAISGWPDFDVPSVAECIDLNLRMGRLTNPAIRCVGVTVNTSGLPEHERQQFLEEFATDVGLPCVDPVTDGCAAIARRLTD
jgi:uncharacterized NAD-dependent epimerase/dehydratase family protein